MKREKLSKAAASGVVALVFLVLGFQAAVFTGNVFNSRREHHTADTVVKIVYMDAAGTVLEQPDGSVAQPASRPAERLEPVKAEVRDPSFVKQGLKPEKPLEYADSRRAVGDRIDAARIKNTELFRFDPNRISVDSLCLLGFSQRQAGVAARHRPVLCRQATLSCGRRAWNGVIGSDRCVFFAKPELISKLALSLI